ncbi:MAG: Diaminopimelate epimerase [Alphaproteobacteria bacterium]|nr:MAG: Diaminopimelate epimerase [Alphaproteobacteria bacterium]
MSETRSIAFSKMNGLGNDFVIIDARDNGLSLSGDDVRALAARNNAQTKGCDQLLVLQPPRGAGDVFMQIFNADGGEVEACGNGTRAVAAYLARSGLATMEIDTLGGTLACAATLADANARAQVAMPLPQIGAPINLHKDLPAALPVNIGNPHAVIFVETGTAGLAAQYGFQLERHKAFPDNANINFASLQGDNILRLDTWERGVGLTKACGTGACASAVAAVTQELCAAGDVTVRPPFNQDDNDTDVLIIDYRPESHVLMHGPVAFEFDGEATL